jgi:hypothetical protein
MHRRMSETILRRSLGAALLLTLPLLAGCGVANPVAPIVSPSHQSGAAAVVAKATKNPNHGGGSKNTQRTGTSSPGPSGAMSGGTTSGQFSDPGKGEVNEPLVTE